MIEAVELTPPKRAEGLMAGDGLVARVGEEGASREGAGSSFAGAGNSSCFGASGSGSGSFASCAVAPPFLFFGPFARPLRTSFKGAPATGGSLAADATDLDDASIPAGLSDLEPLGEPAPGGPRAKRPASPGLKRAASLLVGAAAGGKVSLFFCSGDGALFSSARGRDVVLRRGSAGASCLIDGEGRRLMETAVAFARGASDDAGSASEVVGCSAVAFGCWTSGDSIFGFSLMLFWNRSASGVTLRCFSGLRGGPPKLFFLPSNSLVAKASGLPDTAGGPDGLRSCTIPASFSCFHCSFLAIRLSLSSSLRSRF